MNHPAIIYYNQNNFPKGRTTLTTPEDPLCNTGMGFDILVQEANETINDISYNNETAWILMTGEASVSFASQKHQIKRSCIFEEAPYVIHTSKDTPLVIRAISSRVEWAKLYTPNKKNFSPMLFEPSHVTNEQRGKGFVDDMSLRQVRLVFDAHIRKDSQMVLGEVVSMPGRWSSYPPHHHEQPEIYHYRFDKPQGYGHGELGEEVLKVRSGDTIKISPNLDHSQVAAPGYQMYYLWAIRHLPEKPYFGFTFTEEHAWAGK